MPRRNPPAKWVLPDVVHPLEHICFKIPVPNNRYYLAAFRGALLNLCSAAQWGDDLAHTAREVANVWREIYDQVVATTCEAPFIPVKTEVEFDAMASLFDVFCDENGECHAEFRCDLCDPYIELATKADLVAHPPGTGKQPAPGGGTSNYCNVINGNGGGLVIPIPVSTGDQIRVISAVGNWGDGSLAQYCVDGNTFFIECTGVGATIIGSPDPEPGAPHMSAILRFSTGYVPLYPGASAIVPAGVSREMPVVLANKSSGNGNGGINACFEITNNSAAHWCFDIDFTSTPGGFVNANTTSTSADAVWMPGLGWTAPAGSTFYETYIKRVIALPTGTAVEFDWVGTAFPDDTENISVLSGASHVLNTTAHIGASGTLSGTTSGTGDTVLLDANAGNISMGAAQVAITHARFSGPGTNPFGSSNC